VERLDLGSIRGRPFRKDTDALPAVECLHDRAVDACRIVALAAFNEDRPCPCRQPADDGPTPNVGLGYEAQRTHRLQYPDVQPGNVVRDNDGWRMGRRYVSLNVDAHVQDVEDPARPSFDDSSLPCPADKRKHQRLRGAAIEDVNY